MKIHEYQAKALLQEIGFPTPKGAVLEKPTDLFKVIEALRGDDFVVKAQIHAGGRGKAGGIRRVQGRKALELAVRELLGKKLVTPQTGPSGKQINKLLIEEPVPVQKEFYLALLVDRTRALGLAIGSEAGGVEIEETARVSPEKVKKACFDLVQGWTARETQEFAQSLCGEALAVTLAPLLVKLSEAFSRWEALLVEINPVALTDENRWLALDAKMIFDDNALFRHPEIKVLHDPREEDPREVEAKRSDLSYVGLTGNIGCMVNGAGLAMATMDVIKLAGGMPANFLDVGGGARAEQVEAAFKIILQDPNVKAILVNIFGGIMKCDVIAEGILRAVKQVKLGVPLVVRLEGTRVEEGKRLLRSSGIPIISADGLKEGAEKVVALASRGN